MSNNELTNTQALIDRYYTEEREKKAQALTLASLNLQLNANDLAMLSTIAKRFGKSRDDLAKDVVSNALIDLLSQLEPGERKLIARDADEMANSMAREIAEENGIKDVDHTPNVWTSHDRSFTKIEKKRAKELEEQRKAEAAKQQQAEQQVEQEDSSMQAEAPQIEVEQAAVAEMPKSAEPANAEEHHEPAIAEAVNDSEEQAETSSDSQSVFG
jgi:hypothetical protein